MKKYIELSKEELIKEKNKLEKEFENVRTKGLSFDMSRGKPCKEQLDLSMGMMDILNSKSDLRCEQGIDCRNYGIVDGIIEAKRFMGLFMENETKNIIIYGASSLNIMFDTIAHCMIKGVLGETPWCKIPKVKFLCPVPGYDRHFAICEYFGIEMINIPLYENGPDMDMIRNYVENDDSIKGIWCVPKYSNPLGYSYCDDTVRQFALLKPKAKDFRIFWDNAYCMHHLYPNKKDQDYLIEIVAECERVGSPDMVYKFASTSKMTFPGAGLAAIATSENNIKDLEEQLRIQIIGHDKLNQLRHVSFFKDIDHIIAHMMKHANILRPKFELVFDTLEKELSSLGIASWTKPKGGYFISFNSMNGTAKEIIKCCAEAGLKITPAGATYPYHKDPNDSNIRIAPSFPELYDLKEALLIFCLVVKLVSIKKIMEK
ncbi:MAG: aminotransferase class I/II-fold pyridoxal phosphate-dependent enzyme [Eubacteriales bacterium]|nr:aminotransferase class I/II-fold pyridoxal phosphate-dependent enzyme [Eubacteriales bacterium]